MSSSYIPENGLCAGALPETGQIARRMATEQAENRKAAFGGVASRAAAEMSAGQIAKRIETERIESHRAAFGQAASRAAVEMSAGQIAKRIEAERIESRRRTALNLYPTSSRARIRDAIIEDQTNSPALVWQQVGNLLKEAIDGYAKAK